MNIVSNEILSATIEQLNTESSNTNSVIQSVWSSASNSPAVLDSYVYQDGLNLVYSESENISYGSIIKCREALDRYFSFYFRQLATIPDVNLGINYVINLSKVINYYVQSSNLIIELSNEILSIACLNSTHATNHLNYLDFAVKNNNFEIASAGKTILYVDEDNYSTLTSALAVATAGNMIVVDKMLSESVILKDGVDIWFNAGAGNELNSSNLRLFHTSTNNVNCNIYGLGVFSNNENIFDTNPLFHINGNSTINIGYQEMNTTLIRPCIYAYGHTGVVSVRSKGHTMTGRLLDSDSQNYLFDTDVVKMGNDGAGELVLYPDNTLNTYFYIRNALMTNDSDYFGTLYLQSTSVSIYDLNLINTRAENYGSSPVLQSPQDEKHTVRLFNSHLKADTKVIETQYSQKTNVISYGDTNILNVEDYSDVNLTGTIIIDSNLTIA